MLYSYYTNDDRVGCFYKLNTGTAIPKPSKKQSNALIFSTKIACHNAQNLKIYN